MTRVGGGWWVVGVGGCVPTPPGEGPTGVGRTATWTNLVMTRVIFCHVGGDLGPPAKSDKSPGEHHYKGWGGTYPPVS